MRNLYLRQDLNHQIFLVQKIAIYCFLGTFLSKNTSFRQLELLAAKSPSSDLLVLSVLGLHAALLSSMDILCLPS